MNNPPVHITSTPIILLRHNMLTFIYAIWVIFLLSSSEIAFFLKLLLFAFSFLLLLAHVSGYNLLEISRIQKTFGKESIEFTVYGQIRHVLTMQFAWSCLLAVILLFWLIVIFIVMNVF